jgi:hypothetical protein
VSKYKDIVVVDLTSVITGRVVAVGWEGGLRWTYTGHSKINVTTQLKISSALVLLSVGVKGLPGSLTPTII